MWRSIAMLRALCLSCRCVLLSVGIVAAPGVVSTAPRRVGVLRACAATRPVLAVRAAFLGGGGDRSHSPSFSTTRTCAVNNGTGAEAAATAPSSADIGSNDGYSR